MIRVVHVITGLAADGAENMLFSLVTGMDETRFTNSVVSLTGMGELGGALQQQGIEVHALGLSKSPKAVYKIWKLRRILAKYRPDVVQTWMYHADLLGGLAARSAGIPQIVWGVHHANLDRGSARWSTILTARVCAKLSSRLPERIVFCSDAARSSHSRFGYTNPQSHFIPNGFDTARFHPDPETRSSVRSEIGANPDSVLVGLIGRYHPHKDHAGFISAAALLAREQSNVEFVLCGRDVTSANRAFWSQVEANGLDKRMHALGARTDIPRILTALDVVVSSSRTEAFPLAVGEAMASGVPCVVTDVGDSKALIGETGLVVSAENPEELSKAMKVLVEKGHAYRQALGLAARTRIEASFSLTSIVRRYEELYLEC